MEDLFRSYWWLVFPLAWFVGEGWDSWLRYRRQRDALELIKIYAQQGKEPPAEVLNRLRRRRDDWGAWDAESSGSDRGDRASRRYWRRRYRRYGGWYQVVLYGALTAGFGYAAYSDLFGIREAFVIVAVVMGALALASLVPALASRGRDD